MTHQTPLSRRRLLQVGGLSAAALASPSLFARRALAATDAAAMADALDAADATVFGYGVASGDPTGTSVMLWTRVAPSPDARPGSGLGAPTPVRWEVAGDEAFTIPVRSGNVTTDPAHDHTVKVDVTGLQPYTRYWYRFSALGSTSRVGRTQTAPDDGQVHALRFGVVSCANFTGGYFTPYRYLSQRTDLDMIVFLGDYVYEYGNGDDRYGPAELAGARDHIPATEMVTASDYRQRHGLYKTDPDLQAAHASVPWILIFDDHEVCDNTYKDGGNNHQPDTEGDFLVRRAGAYAAYIDWMPIRLPDQSVPHAGTRFWRSFSYGPLADAHALESRQNRDEEAATGSNDVINDPTRVLIEPEQMDWLTAGLAAPTAAWHLVFNQVVLAQVRLGALPQDALATLNTLLTPTPAAGQLPAGGEVFNTDQWDGYAFQQAQLLQAMADSAGAGDVVVYTGDIHSSWANDLPLDPGTYVPVGPLNNSVGVEFVTPSVTSDGFMEIFGSAQAATGATTAFMAANRHVRYLEGIHHGYLVTDVTPERVQTDYWYMSDRTDPQATQSLGASYQTVAASKQITTADAEIGARSDTARLLTAAAAPAAPEVTAPAAPSAPATSSALASTGLGSGTVVAGVAATAAALAVARHRQGQD